MATQFPSALSFLYRPCSKTLPSFNVTKAAGLSKGDQTVELRVSFSLQLPLPREASRISIPAVAGLCPVLAQCPLDDLPQHCFSLDHVVFQNTVLSTQPQFPDRVSAQAESRPSVPHLPLLHF